MKKLEYLAWSPRILGKALKDYINGKIPTAYLELTAKCSHASCIYCDSPINKFEGEELKFGEIEDLIQKLKKLGLEWIFVCGLGEPREQEKFFEILDFLKKEDICLSFFTNCLEFEEGDIARLVEHRDHINIIPKLDSLNPEIFDKHLGRKGTAKIIYKFIDDLIEGGFVKISEHGEIRETNMAVNIAPTKLNLNSIPDVMDFCIKNDIFPSIGEVEYAGEATGILKKIGVDEGDLKWLEGEAGKVLGYKYERHLCRGIISSLHISNVGKIFIDGRTGLSCGWFFQKDPVYVEIGDVRKDDLSEVVQRIKEYRLRKLHQIEELLPKERDPVISAGGGTKPSTWCGSYIKCMEAVNKREGILKYKSRRLFIEAFQPWWSRDEPYKTLQRYAKSHPDYRVVLLYTPPPRDTRYQLSEDRFFGGDDVISKREEGNLTVYVGDAANLTNEKDMAYDYIQMDFVLSYDEPSYRPELTNPDAEKILDELKRVLIPGGTLKISDVDRVGVDISGELGKRGFVEPKESEFTPTRDPAKTLAKVFKWVDTDRELKVREYTYIRELRDYSTLMES